MVRWNLEVTFGDPQAPLLEEAKQRGADLIATGTERRTGLARVLLGSAADGVIRGAPCDVLVARMGAPP
jgi:nucleotide-binding universal stress UspA family protein